MRKIDKELEYEKKAIARKKALGIYRDKMYQPSDKATKHFKRKPYTYGSNIEEVK